MCVLGVGGTEEGVSEGVGTTGQGSGELKSQDEKRMEGLPFLEDALLSVPIPFIRGWEEGLTPLPAAPLPRIHPRGDAACRRLGAKGPRGWIPGPCGCSLPGHKESSLFSPWGHRAPEGEREARAGVWMPLNYVPELTLSPNT